MADPIAGSTALDYMLQALQTVPTAQRTLALLPPEVRQATLNNQITQEKLSDLMKGSAAVDQAEPTMDPLHRAILRGAISPEAAGYASGQIPLNLPTFGKVTPDANTAAHVNILQQELSERKRQGITKDLLDVFEKFPDPATRQAFQQVVVGAKDDPSKLDAILSNPAFIPFLARGQSIEQAKANSMAMSAEGALYSGYGHYLSGLAYTLGERGAAAARQTGNPYLLAASTDLKEANSQFNEAAKNFIALKNGPNYNANDPDIVGLRNSLEYAWRNLQRSQADFDYVRTHMADQAGEPTANPAAFGLNLGEKDLGNLMPPKPPGWGSKLYDWATGKSNGPDMSAIVGALPKNLTPQQQATVTTLMSRGSLTTPEQAASLSSYMAAHPEDIDLHNWDPSKKAERPATARPPSAPKPEPGTGGLGLSSSVTSHAPPAGVSLTPPAPALPFPPQAGHGSSAVPDNIDWPAVLSTLRDRLEKNGAHIDIRKLRVIGDERAQAKKLQEWINAPWNVPRYYLLDQG